MNVYLILGVLKIVLIRVFWWEVTDGCGIWLMKMFIIWIYFFIDWDFVYQSKESDLGVACFRHGENERFV
jgi:uncharacterized iron-regulated membrane protein